MHADGDWLAVDEVLTKNMATVREYLQTWKLQLSRPVATGRHLGALPQKFSCAQKN